MCLFYSNFTKKTCLLFTRYAFIDYTWNIFVINLPIYACKWSFLVQAGACLWAKCIGEPRAYITSAVLPLPFVNMDPSKLSTMYTCIMLAAEQLKEMWMVLYHYHVWPSSWTDKRDGSGWGATYSPSRRQHSARRISLLAFVHGFGRYHYDRKWYRCL